MKKIISLIVGLIVFHSSYSQEFSYGQEFIGVTYDQIKSGWKDAAKTPVHKMLMMLVRVNEKNPKESETYMLHFDDNLTVDSYDYLTDNNDIIIKKLNSSCSVLTPRKEWSCVQNDTKIKVVIIRKSMTINGKEEIKEYFNFQIAKI